MRFSSKIITFNIVWVYDGRTFLWNVKKNCTSSPKFISSSYFNGRFERTECTTFSNTNQKTNPALRSLDRQHLSTTDVSRNSHKNYVIWNRQLQANDFSAGSLVRQRKQRIAPREWYCCRFQKPTFEKNYFESSQWLKLNLMDKWELESDWHLPNKRFSLRFDQYKIQK